MAAKNSGPLGATVNFKMSLRNKHGYALPFNIKCAQVNIKSEWVVIWAQHAQCRLVTRVRPPLSLASNGHQGTWPWFAIAETHALQWLIWYCPQTRGHIRSATNSKSQHRQSQPPVAASPRARVGPLTLADGRAGYGREVCQLLLFGSGCCVAPVSARFSR
jgi:hypothetical protein